MTILASYKLVTVLCAFMGFSARFIAAPFAVNGTGLPSAYVNGPLSPRRGFNRLPGGNFPEWQSVLQ